jgi:hypothetical protein
MSKKEVPMSAPIDEGRDALSILDKEGRNRSRICDRFSMVMKIAEKEWAYVSLNCRSKLCPKCAPKIAARRAADIARAIKENDLRFHVTLFPPSGHDRNDVVRLLRASWAGFRVSFKRRFKEPLTFVRVLEVSPADVAHFHVLIHHEITRDWLANNWANNGGGPLVDIGPIDNGPGFANYLIKQIEVRPANALPPGTRLIATSRNIRLRAEREKFPSRRILRPTAELRSLAGEHFLRNFRDGFVADTEGIGR